ncbi:uncharacterized protein LOC118774569, partial [Megalops cyprinoides]|uniref:uncharacterized protein LOC118774569 n=1 Tax=Megalops cyprinoides TaxID=118141 RepID=UPI001863C78C
NKETACSNFAPELHSQFLSLCPDCDEAVQQEQRKQHDADQHSQSEENEALPHCCESIQRERPSETPPDHTPNSGSLEESCADRKNPVPEEEKPYHTLPQEGATNHSHSQRPTAETCWYCMKSLNTEALKKLQPIARGKRVSYQHDPRPHFGVPRSSRSTTVPLWGYEGPLRGERAAEEADQMSTCPHCHLALPPDTLRWHETKCLIFEGIKNSLAK